MQLTHILPCLRTKVHNLFLGNILEDPLGISIHQISEKIDEGDVFYQSELITRKKILLLHSRIMQRRNIWAQGLRAL